MSADNYTDCPACGLKDVVREDYEVGLSPSTGKFFVDYSASCCGPESGNPANGCGFDFHYSHEENVRVEKITATLRTRDGFEKKAQVENAGEIEHAGRVFRRESAGLFVEGD